ncbi:MAG: cytochrome c3 family protein [Deltaproteobacteria bacterium]|jgi:hypothetical protein
MRGKGKHGRLFALILAAGLALSGGIVVSGYGQEKASNPSDLNVIVINNEGYETNRKGPVIFTHLKHARYYEVSCWDCHHEYEDGKNVWAPWTGTVKCSECHMPSMNVEGVMNLQKAYHVNCKGCHEERAKEGKTHGPYRKCYGCHERES